MMDLFWRGMHWLIGYASVELRGGDGERLLTLCRKEEMDLWSIRRVCPGILEVRVYLYALPQLLATAPRCGVSAEISGRFGLMPFLKRYRLRPGLFAGVLLYLTVLFFLSRFVWAVEIPGADPVQYAAIRDDLLRSGFGVGTFIPSVDYKELKYDLMLSDGNIAFVSVNQTGCRAVVDVRFTRSAPLRIDDDTPCNLVANRDGQIVSILVQDGVRYVKKGQVVQKGDLLIGGIFDTRLGYYVVHAKGQVLARVNDVFSETVALERMRQVPTGRRQTKRVWTVFGKTVDLTPHFSCDYAFYDTKTTVKHLSFGSSAVPVLLTETVYYETCPEKETCSEEQAVQEARTLLTERERIWDSGADVESMEEEVVVTAQDVTLIRRYSVITDICEEKEFYFEDEG